MMTRFLPYAIKASLMIALVIAVIFSPVRAAQAESDTEFLIGLIPEENIFHMVEKHRPLAEYLTEELGVKVRFTILSRYGDVIDRFTVRELDGAFFGIFTAALASDKLGVVPIAKPVLMNGETAAWGTLIARKDSGLRSFTDLKGKTAAFVDRATATGYIFAIAYLRENGVKDIDEFLGDYFFTGSHTSIITSVLDGKADFGAVKNRVLEKSMQKDPPIEDELYIMETSVDLPLNTLFISSSIDNRMKQELKAALLGLDKDPRGAVVLETLGYRKFIEAKDSDFDAVRELARKAGIDIREYKYR